MCKETNDYHSTIWHINADHYHQTNHNTNHNTNHDSDDNDDKNEARYETDDNTGAWYDTNHNQNGCAERQINNKSTSWRHDDYAAWGNKETCWNQISDYRQK